MRLYERNHICNVLERSDHDKRKAAPSCSASACSSLYRKLDELEIDKGPAFSAVLDHQHRAGRIAQRGLGDAAEQQALMKPPSPRAPTTSRSTPGSEAARTIS